MRWPVAICALTLLQFVVVTSSCSSESEEASRDLPSSSVSPPALWRGGGAPPIYEEPVTLVPGDYVSPAGLPDAYERGLAAAAAERGKPAYEAYVNGIRLYSFDHALSDPGVNKVFCGGDKFNEFKEVTRLEYDYLPPGTAALTPQSSAVCPDGSVASFGQRFVAHNVTFDIWWEGGELALGHDAAEARISSSEIAGRKAVVIRPLTEEGFGRSWVAVVMDHGLLVFDARDLPLDQTIKIANGVSCSDC